MCARCLLLTLLAVFKHKAYGVVCACVWFAFLVCGSCCQSYQLLRLTLAILGRFLLLV
jgi:hypothetical protein